jgi:hypothetical protein
MKPSAVALGFGYANFEAIGWDSSIRSLGRHGSHYGAGIDELLDLEGLRSA